MTEFSQLDQLAVNTLRILAIDQVEEAKSGHPGMPLGAAPTAYVLWSRFLRHDPEQPGWPGRDRFILSAGHGSALLYALLHLFGYELPISELRRFRQWGSHTPGHPEFGLTPGVEVTTGPLGQGLAAGVGMALAERHLAATFNRDEMAIFNNRTFVLASDGDLQEGLSHEAAALAGHWKLGRLVVLWDDNRITIDGPTSLAWSENTAARFEAYGWRVLHVEDGNDLAAIHSALESAVAGDDRPVLIRVRTTIGFGAPTRAGTAAAHGAPLGAVEAEGTRKALGWPHPAPFTVPEDVRNHCAARTQTWREARVTWEQRWHSYSSACPQQAATLERRWRRELPPDWESCLPAFDDMKPVATRAASGRTLNALAAELTELVGGSADLSESNNVSLARTAPISGADPAGRTVHFGIREHAMAGIANGLSLYGAIRPFVATFLIFSDYLRPSLRLAALMKQPVIYIFTHDSLGVGEDGPTHQPVEQLDCLRLIPGLVVLRPADAHETAAAWQVALERTEGPTAMVLSRQGLPVLDRPKPGQVARGAFIREEAGAGDPTVVILASGSEVHTALDARTILEEQGVATRVVSVPSLELFASQDVELQRQILGPRHALRVTVEAGRGGLWQRWVGDGEVICLDRFGASAPGEEVLSRLGFSAQNVVGRVRAALAGRSPATLDFDVPNALRERNAHSVEVLCEQRVLDRLMARDETLFGKDHISNVVKRMGWLDLPGRSRTLLPILHRLCGEMANDGIRTLVLLGMGGSSLAPEVLQQVGGTPSGRTLIVLDTTDPDRVAGVLRRIDVTTTAVVAVSKSGATAETSTLLAICWQHFVDRLGEEAGHHFLAITEPGSTLDSLARERGFRSVLPHPVDVGGRFSALAVVGLLPAVWLGQDGEKLLRGGERVLSGIHAEHPAARLACLLSAAAGGRRAVVAWAASPILEPVFAWAEQLIAESTGKNGRGILPVALRKIPVDGRLWPGTVVLSPRCNHEDVAALDQELDSVQAAGHPVARLTFSSVDLGQCFVLLELTTALTGFLLDVNPFDEPDVVLAKQRARAALAAPPARGAVTETDPVGRIRRHLRGLSGYDAAAILAYVPETAANADALTRLAEQLTRETGAPVTGAFGPRYLHSTGQLHKGGPTGLRAVVLTADPEADMPIPGQPHTLGQLRFAQAMGDVAALQEAGRAVLHLHVGRALIDLLDTLGGGE